MNDDELFRSYLTTRAGAIDLPEGDAAGVHQRAERRHRRRRNGALGVTGLIATIGLTVALTAGSDDSSLQTAAGPGAVASALRWQVVDTTTGLGWTSSSIVAGSSGLYALSTAPGPLSEDGLAGDGRQRLYRSGNGSDWSEIDLPAELWASSLTANGDQLYAVGTSPAGGGTRSVVLASSDDGGANWSTVELPTGLAELQARSPREVIVSGLSVTNGPGGVVATMAVQAVPDIGKRLSQVAPDLAYDGGWNMTATGIDVLAAPAGCSRAATGSATNVSGSASDAVREACAFDPTDQPVVGTFTWAELGVDPELVDLIGGRPLVFVSSDGDTFEPVELPAGTTGTTPEVVASADGYVLALGRQDRGAPYQSQTAVLRSADGRAWSDDPGAATDGYPADAGLLAGRPAFAVYGEGGGMSVRVLGEDGSWSLVDLAGVMTQPAAGSEYGVHGVAFGPLGLAAAVNVYSEQEGKTLGSYLLHTLDGNDVSVVPLNDYVDDTESVVGIAISADAVVVRVNGPTDSDPETPVPQRAIVGTLP
jgi:hypothetical protein